MPISTNLSHWAHALQSIIAFINMVNTSLGQTKFITIWMIVWNESINFFFFDGQINNSNNTKQWDDIVREWAFYFCSGTTLNHAQCSTIIDSHSVWIFAVSYAYVICHTSFFLPVFVRVDSHRPIDANIFVVFFLEVSRRSRKFEIHGHSFAAISKHLNSFTDEFYGFEIVCLRNSLCFKPTMIIRLARVNT